jgi:hypothetical protein
VGCNSMEQSPPLEANSRTASQRIRRPLWNPKFRYRVHKSTPLAPVLRGMNPVVVNTCLCGTGVLEMVAWNAGNMGVKISFVMNRLD